MMNLQS